MFNPPSEHLWFFNQVTLKVILWNQGRKPNTPLWVVYRRPWYRPPSFGGKTRVVFCCFSLQCFWHGFSKPCSPILKVLGGWALIMVLLLWQGWLATLATLVGGLLPQICCVKVCSQQHLGPLAERTLSCKGSQPQSTDLCCQGGSHLQHLMVHTANRYALHSLCPLPSSPALSLCTKIWTCKEWNLKARMAGIKTRRWKQF
jgi:hypothetical protein